MTDMRNVVTDMREVVTDMRRILWILNEGNCVEVYTGKIRKLGSLYHLPFHNHDDSQKKLVLRRTTLTKVIDNIF